MGLTNSSSVLFMASLVLLGQLVGFVHARATPRRLGMPDAFDAPAIQKPPRLPKASLSRKVLGAKQVEEDRRVPKLVYDHQTGRFRAELVPDRRPLETFEYVLDECIGWLLVFLLAGFVVHQAVKEFKDRQRPSLNQARQGPFRTAQPTRVNFSHVHGCCMVTLETSKKGCDIIPSSIPPIRQGGLRLRNHALKDDVPQVDTAA